jgi:hypothetical protein
MAGNLKCACLVATHAASSLPCSSPNFFHGTCFTRYFFYCLTVNLVKHTRFNGIVVLNFSYLGKLKHSVILETIMPVHLFGYA